MKASLILALCTLTFAADAHAARRALLIGINDYSASLLGRPAPGTPERDWPNLRGAVNDSQTLQQMLVLLYGVRRGEIVSLTDQAATRAAILRSLDHLAAGARKDDVVLFYFAGHGSQVHNPDSDERDKLDEAIVPADSRLGVGDIRDKELRGRFNRILDRGAKLTVILDNCYSGSGARGLSVGALVRGIKPSPREVRDGADYGPRPESRGALVLSAAEDDAVAQELRDPDGKFHGVFSWALIRAIRNSIAGESAAETFARAQALIRTEMPYQSPVLAGTPQAKLAPFLGERIDRRGDLTVVGVAKVRDDEALLEGGWANGLAVGTELKETKSGARLRVTKILGLGESVARVLAGPKPEPGGLAEVVGWAAPPGPPLRVCVPRADLTDKEIGAFARKLHEIAARRRLRWVVNPIDSPASHILRWRRNGWELARRGGGIRRVGNDAAAIAAVQTLPPNASLFVQFPVPAAIAAAIPGDSVDFDDADYILVGRHSRRGLWYAWMRPAVKRADRRHSALPLHTAWFGTAAELGQALTRLRRIHAWQMLESPPQARFPYRLQIRRKRGQRLIGDGESIVAGEEYVLGLRAYPLPANVRRRYVYVFVIDGNGKSQLLFPQADAGSVENRLPDGAPSIDIELPEISFTASPPYGVDTYILLSTDQPLPNPAILTWDGVRALQQEPRTALEQLLVLTATASRSKLIVTPASWSIERITRESLAPRRATKPNGKVSLLRPSPRP